MVTVFMDWGGPFSLKMTHLSHIGQNFLEISVTTSVILDRTMLYNAESLFKIMVFIYFISLHTGSVVDH